MSNPAQSQPVEVHMKVTRNPVVGASLLSLALLLAACGDKEEASGPKAEDDPAATAALNDEIMVDPDLANQNEANAALTGGSDASLPPENVTPEAIAAAKDEAAALVGGAGNLAPPPEAKMIEGSIPESATLTAASRSAVTPGGQNCAEGVNYSARWAARLPAALPVYPRGSTREAAGTDEGQCALRVVNFLTPVGLDDVLSFYNTRAKSAGYSVEHIKKDGDNILSGVKGTASYVVYARQAANGITAVDLITSGQ
ncbi:MAG: hypothetical protein ACK5NN_07720 [Sphingomonadaceae bacterium]